MSSEKSAELLWRETYFILFPQENRPTLAQVKDALTKASERLLLENLAADDQGWFASLLVESPEDHAAVEVSYEMGDAVIEQNLEWAKQLQDQLPAEQLQQIVRSDARLDVAHFELKFAEKSQTSAGDSFSGNPFVGGESSGEFPSDDFSEEFSDEEVAFDMLDPTCLLTVVGALATLTEGVTFDPASGEILA